MASLLGEKLRCKILVGAAECIRLLEAFSPFLGYSEVSQSYVAFILVQKNILRLQVSVNDIFAVDVVEGQNNLGGYEPDLGF